MGPAAIWRYGAMAPTTIPGHLAALLSAPHAYGTGKRDLLCRLIFSSFFNFLRLCFLCDAFVCFRASIRAQKWRFRRSPMVPIEVLLSAINGLLYMVSSCFAGGSTHCPDPLLLFWIAFYFSGVVDGEMNLPCARSPGSSLAPLGLLLSAGASS